MIYYYNDSTIIDDSLSSPLSRLELTHEEVLASFSSYILSPSGIRHVFAASKDEEDSRELVSDADKVITATIAKAFFDFVGEQKPKLLVGTDTRPTGRILASVINRILTSLGAKVTFLFYSAAPEIMAYSRAGFDAFCYISASHNPVGHNGFKFGRCGGVYPAEESLKLIDMIKDMVSDPSCIQRAREICAAMSVPAYEKVLDLFPEAKAKALEYYENFVMETAGVSKDFKARLGIVADFNGSARSVSIDKAFLKQIGVNLKVISGKPGEIKHAIVPENENLIPCKEVLEKQHLKDESFLVGYACDNDGDRGNFVYIDEMTDKGAIIQAQEVFAMVVAIELAEKARSGVKNLAVAVNGPTSERIDEIASTFGAKVFRAEVGEANVVSLGESLREQGYSVPILGEGSNGGNITYPAKVRDPLNSVMTILKLFNDEGLYTYLTEKLGKRRGRPSVKGLLESLPLYTTTGAFSKKAKLQVKNTDYSLLKTKYEANFVSSFESMNLKKHKITDYEFRQTEGIREKTGMGSALRSQGAKGGLKVILKKEDGSHVAYMWLRPSGTEPVLRCLVDVKGVDWPLHDLLLDWQRRLITEADSN